MSKFLLEQLDSKFEELEEKETLEINDEDFIIYLKGTPQIDDEEIDEANVSGNMDGGAGPPKTPYAFSKSGKLDGDHIEVSGYKKVKKQKNESKIVDLIEDKIENLIEITYKDYKNDESQSTKKKINLAIKEINSKMFQVERLVKRNLKLKTEMGVDSSSAYWKSTILKLEKINHRMELLSKVIKEFSNG